MRRQLVAYLAVVRTAARHGLDERAALLGRVLFYGVILLIFWGLWRVVLESGALRDVGAVELLWYLAVTEWIMLSLPLLYLEIERDVRSGEIAYRLTRPLSYLGTRIAEGTGSFAVRGAVLGVSGALLARTVSGGWPADPRGLLLALPLGLLAAALGLVLQAMIGLSALWLQDASPVYWVFQKLVFVLGGLMLPLEIYPTWLRTIAQASPFAALLWGPGRLAFGLDWAFAGEVALRLVIWLGIASGCLWWVYRRGLAVLDVNGG